MRSGLSSWVVGSLSADKSMPRWLPGYACFALGISLVLLNILVLSVCFTTIGASKPEPLYKLKLGKGWVRALQFSTDSSLLLAGAAQSHAEMAENVLEGYLALWSMSSGDKVCELRLGEQLEDASFTDSDSRIVAVGSQGRLQIWETDHCSVYKTITYAVDDVVSVAGYTIPAVSLSPDGEELAVVSLNSSETEAWIEVFDLSTRRKLTSLKPEGDYTDDEWVGCPLVLLNGSWLLTYNVCGGGASLWDVETGRHIHTLVESGGAWAGDVATNGVAAAGCAQGEVVLYESGRNTALEMVKPACATFSQNGEMLFAAGEGVCRIWDVTSGRELVTWVSPVGHFPCTATFSQNGDYLATGDHGGSILVWSVADIIHPMVPPEARFTFSPSSPTAGDPILFHASKSTDPDGRIVDYAWDWNNDGRWDHHTSAPVTEYAFSVSDKYQVTLQVTDDHGATDTTVLAVEVVENKAPTASFTFSPSDPTILDTVYFTHTSFDPDGQIVSWQWEFGEGYASSVSNPHYQYQSAGTYTVTLSVTDNNSATDSSSQTITVIDVVLVPPIPSFTLSATHLLIDQQVSFDASASSDPAGTIVNYEWDFGDGTDREGIVVTHAYTAAGTYTVKLTVTDNDGQSASIAKEVKVFQHGGSSGPA